MPTVHYKSILKWKQTIDQRWRLLKIGSLKNLGKPLSAVQGFLGYMPEHGLQFQRTCGSPIRRLFLGYQTHLLARGLHKVHQTDWGVPYKQIKSTAFAQEFFLWKIMFVNETQILIQSPKGCIYGFQWKAPSTMRWLHTLQMWQIQFEFLHIFRFDVPLTCVCEKIGAFTPGFQCIL